MQVLTTTPMVPFRLQYDDSAVDLESPLDFPAEKTGAAVLEPTVNCTIITPATYTGPVLQLCAARRGDLLVCLLAFVCCCYRASHTQPRGNAPL